MNVYIIIFIYIYMMTMILVLLLLAGFPERLPKAFPKSLGGDRLRSGRRAIATPYASGGTHGCLRHDMNDMSDMQRPEIYNDDSKTYTKHVLSTSIYGYILLSFFMIIIHFVYKYINIKYICKNL